MMRIGIYVIALIAIVSIGASTPLVVSTAYAQNPREGLDNAFKWAEIKTTKANLPVVAGNILRIFLGLVGLGSMLAFVYGGAIWMQARGNQEDVKKGKDIIKYAALGVAVATTAYAIVNFAANELDKRLKPTAQGQTAPCYCPPPVDECFENRTPGECQLGGCTIVALKSCDDFISAT